MPGAQRDITQFFSPKTKENQSKVSNKVESQESGDRFPGEKRKRSVNGNTNEETQTRKYRIK